MTHPYAQHREATNAPARAKHHLRGYASGGAVKTDPSVTPAVRGSVETPASRADNDGCGFIGKRANGGKVASAVHKHEGHLHKGQPKTRLDKFARGGAPKSKKGKGNHVNIVIGAPAAGAASRAASPRARASCSPA